MSTDSLPPKLYHYCSNQAAMNILRDRKIRLSHIAGMNDHREGSFVLHATEDRVGDRRHLALTRILQARLWQYDPFLCCLSAESDSLSQWLIYGDDGQGCAVGFDTRKLIDHLQLQLDPPVFSARAHERAYLCQVDYVTPEEAPARVVPILDELLATGIPLEELDRRPLDRQTYGAHRDYFDREAAFFGYAIRCKSDRFRAENEWRILQCFAALGFQDDTVWEDIFWRDCPYGITCFREFDVSDAVTELWIGPRNRTMNSIMQRFITASRYDSDFRFYRSAASIR